jgi:hypothetical protein
MGGIQSRKIEKLTEDINKVNNITQSDLFVKKSNLKILFSYHSHKLTPSTISVNIVNI